ncbi:trithorax group protein osa-like isoform X3 [Mya arenaria]|uniref:trithorax group protein osa-like isoform X3 n=1 Tax=Mya arenaria TaxID=6604 RepID=UPI0022E8B1E2|nr:trithorax group protein osa-like isoform X3 [Mya arenaria]
MEGSYMSPEMSSYGPGPGEPGHDGYGRMSDNMQMSQYSSHNRPGYVENMSNEYGSQGYGQYSPSGNRGGYTGQQRPGMRPGSQNIGLMPGQQGYNPGQQRMMSGQSISQQSGPTPTLNQLLQNPNSQQRFSNTYEGYSGPQKGPDMGPSNGPYSMPPAGWIQQNQRGMGNYPQMSMPGSSSYRGQNHPFNQGYVQQTSGAQFSNQGTYQQQQLPTNPAPGSLPQQQRPTPQPSPHLPVSPVPSPSPASRVTPNHSPGPNRPPPQPSPGQQRLAQHSPAPSQRSAPSQLSPPGTSAGHHNTQLNHLSSPKESSSFEDVRGEATSMRDSSRPETSPGSVGSRSNTPASLSGASPMPPRPPSQQDGNQRMSHSPMSASGYNQQMMPPPMGPGQMGAGYNPGNYPMRQPGPGMGNYPTGNMYNGPSMAGQMGPGGQPMYNNMPGGPAGMSRGNYSNMYQGNMMGMNNQYGSYGGPGQNAQGGPPQGPNGMPNSGPSANGPQGNMNSQSGSNGPMPGPQTPGATPIKGAQAAAQAAMAAANAAARSQQPPTPVTPTRQMNPSQPPSRMGYNAAPGMPMPGQPPHNMPPQSMSPLSHMNQMNPMGYNPSGMNMPPHPQNSVSPVPPSMPVGKMHNNSNSVSNYSAEQPLPKSKSTKSKSSNANSNSSGPPSVPNNLQHNSIASPNMPMPSPGMSDGNSQGARPSSTPASTLSDTGSHSNDSSSMGPLMTEGQQPAQGSQNSSPAHGPTSHNTDNGTSSTVGAPSDANQLPMRTTANAVETSTTVTQSITSPVTSLSIEGGNSNDSHSLPPMEPIPAMQNCIPTPSQDDPGEPPEKKKKTEVTGISQLAFTRVAPSPGGASIASSGTHEDIDNIGSPSGWGSGKSGGGGGGDYMKLYEMGMEGERKPFLDRLFAFLDEKGSPISNMPVISKQPIDLYRLYVIVQEKGGMVEVTKAKKWKEICGLINVSGSASAAFTLKKNYIKFLFAHECRYDRGNMDPAPVLAQMDQDLEKKRAAKNKHRAPSPASQSSQDGMPSQYMGNDQHMGHMGQGMIGNHMMNNMAPHAGPPHAGPMMGPNSMGGPHHMGPGMQAPGHMMGGSMGHQNYGGNYGNMMQPGPNMMGNSMSQGPQGSMIGPGGMQGPNGMMGGMGPGGPQQGNMMPHNNMGQHGMMGNMNNMNMPANSMMPHNMMQGGNMGHQSGMMPPSSQMNQMNNPMMRNNSGQGPNGMPMMPPNSMGNTSMPNSMPVRINNDSVSCQDPFADEPYQKSNSQPMPYPSMQQQPNSGSNSPMPPSSMPISSVGGMMSSSGPMQGGGGPPHMTMSSSGGPVMSSGQPNSSQSSFTPPSSGAMSMTPGGPNQMPLHQSPIHNLNDYQQGSQHQQMQQQPHSQQQQQQQHQQQQNEPMKSEPYQNNTDMPPSSVMSRNASLPPHQNQSMGSPAPPSNASTPTPSLKSEYPAKNESHMFSQDSNSNSSMPEYTVRHSEPTSTTYSATQQSMGHPGTDSSSSQFSNTTNTVSSSGRQFPFGDNKFNKPDRFDQGSPSLTQSGPASMSQTQMVNQPPISMPQGPVGPVTSMGHSQATPMGHGQATPIGTGQATPIGPGQTPGGHPVHMGHMGQQGPMTQSGHMPQGPIPQQSPMGPVPMSQHGPMNQPGHMPSQAGNQQGPMGQGPMQGPMNYQQPGGPGGVPHPPYMNQQPGMEPVRYGHQGPEQYSQQQSYHGGNTSHGNFPPRPPIVKNDQGYPGSQGGQYGNQPMQGGMYGTPNKRYPDNRNDYMSPAYGSQPYNGSNSMGNYIEPQYQGPQPYNEYSDTSSASYADRSQGGWPPMMQRPYNQNMPPYGPPSSMGPHAGPPNLSRRMSPTPRYRDHAVSPGKQKMPQGAPMGGSFKKDSFFPFDSIESTQPLLNKRRKLNRHDVGPNGYRPVFAGGRRSRLTDTGQIEAWRIMMSLKSGLLAESTWALDTLNILLYDDATVAYFGLGHLPGLLEVLLDHLRRCLLEIFDIFEESQIESGHEEFKENLVRMAILESVRKDNDESAEEVKEINRVNKSLACIENGEENGVEEAGEEEEKSEIGEDSLNKSDDSVKEEEEKETETAVKEEPARPPKPRRNYTHITRQGREVKLEEGSDPDGLCDSKIWDVYGESGDQSESWVTGKGPLTEHVVTHLEDLNEHKNSSRRFFRRPMKRKADSCMDVKIEKSEDIKDEHVIKDEKIDMDVYHSNKDCESEVHSNNDNLDNEKCETSSNNTDCSCEKDHTCNAFIKSVTLKSEPRDLLPEKNDSDDSNCDDKLGVKSFFRDEPRMKLAVKYELLDSDELEQTCKTQFGLNTEGERNSVEDESYQRNEPPLCLTSEAQHELGRRCICVSNIFRNLSFIPGNDVEMSRHSGLIYILGKLLLLHHKHLPRSRVRRRFDRDDIEEDMVDTSQGIDEWWWDCLNVLRENTLVTFANICAQLKLDIFPDEICLPIIDGLLHWVVCPSSCASDPLPTVGPASVLSPQRLVLEALCKLCIHDKNVDMLLASPPYERIVQLFSVLTKLLANKGEQVTMEFSVVLLSELVRGGSSAARGIALQHPSISLLIDFIETAEQKAMQVANMHTVQMLRDNPEMMGTSLDMIRRAASVLTHLARVPDNRKMFVHHQNRLLALVMSQILDHNVASQLSDVLFQCSQLS